MMMALALVTALFLGAATVQAKPGTLAWQFEAFSQKDINTYVWRYYLNSSKKGKKFKGVVCKESELPGTFNCTVLVPRVVGWLRISGTHPRLGEGYVSAAIYIPSR